MKKKIFTIALVALLFVIVGFMIYDLFSGNKKSEMENPYEYNIEAYKQVDSSEICYKQLAVIDVPLSEVCGLAVISNNAIVVTGVDSLLIFNSDGQLQKGIVLSQHAHCLTAAHNKLYFGMGDHVEVADSTGRVLQKWKSLGDSAIITSIAVTENAVFVADAGNKVVNQFKHDGTFIRNIGKRDTKNNNVGFVIPSAYFDMAVGSSGELWVVNPGKHQFEQYAESGKLQSSWQKTSMGLDGFSGCCNPTHIAILPDGAFVTSEKGLVRVKIHEPTGEFRCVVAAPKQFDEETTGLDIAVDANNRILILDPSRLQVRIFGR